MAPHSSTLAWQIPWTEEPGRLQSMGLLRVGNKRLHFDFSLSCIGEGNGNPLQCSCLEDPRDGGAWWAAVCGVAQSQTRLTGLSSKQLRHPLQCSCLENTMDTGARWTTVLGIAKSQTGLIDFHETSHNSKLVLNQKTSFRIWVCKKKKKKYQKYFF